MNKHINSYVIINFYLLNSMSLNFYFQAFLITFFDGDLVSFVADADPRADFLPVGDFPMATAGGVGLLGFDLIADSFLDGDWTSIDWMRLALLGDVLTGLVIFFLMDLFLDGFDISDTETSAKLLRSEVNCPLLESPAVRNLSWLVIWFVV